MVPWRLYFSLKFFFLFACLFADFILFYFFSAKGQVEFPRASNTLGKYSTIAPYLQPAAVF